SIGRGQGGIGSGPRGRGSDIGYRAIAVISVRCKLQRGSGRYRCCGRAGHGDGGQLFGAVTRVFRVLVAAAAATRENKTNNQNRANYRAESLHTTYLFLNQTSCVLSAHTWGARLRTMCPDESGLFLSQFVISFWMTLCRPFHSLG